MQLQPIDLVRGEIELPTLSNIYLQFTQKLDQPGAKADDFAEIISADPALTAKLLKIVNSAYYSFSATITDVGHAITIVGLTELREIVLAICVVDYFEGLPNKLISMEEFWEHSIYTGLMAREMQRSLSIETSDSMFTVGLLHDLGSLVFYNRLPEIARSVLEISERQERSRFEVEREELGFDHAAIGAALIEHWGLPEFLIQVIKFHHSPDQIKDQAIENLPEHSKQVLILNMADKISRLVEKGGSGADILEVNRNYQALGLKNETLLACKERVDEQLQSVLSAVQAV